ncbi:Ankyrin repeat-containing domain,Ankyrin repeat [Cinara cedri]|uniref:Ankyrin repeat-containing domain,Ankyrin repeat n=1 Tax=Cinara cedri TaxID=506608 RepID=A0A5E4MFR1_9HEMI|nr:Ankyrin repeat-containing domain,Ankyrin repeat [Cinara cedri]
MSHINCVKVNMPTFDCECFESSLPNSSNKKTKYKNLKLSQKRLNEKKLPVIDSMFQISYDINIYPKSTVDNFMSLYNKVSTFQRDYTPLHLAIEMGNFHLVQLLLKLPTINVNTFTSTGFTGLHMAIKSANLSIVKYLCEYSDVDLEATSSCVGTPLIYATLISTPIILKILIDHGADVNKTFTADCLNSLMLAIHNEKKEQSWILAESGICPLHTDVKKWNALHYGALFKGSVELLRKLIEIGCDQNGITREGMTPLHHAVISGRIDAVRILVEMKSDLNKTDENGLTALHYAAYQGQWEIVKILLGAGSRPNKKTNSKVTPLHFAAKHDRYLVVKELLKCYVDVNAMTMQCNTPLHYAACNGNAEMVDILLKNGADLNIPNKDNDLPIHLACLRGAIDVVKSLCLNESNIDCRNKNNMSPLHNAILSSNEELVKFLLKKYKFSIDNELYHVTLRSGNVNIIKFVIDKTNETMLKDEVFWYKIIGYSGSLEVVKLFFNRVQPPTLAISSLVVYAIHLGYVDIARYLLKYVYGWNDLIDGEGNTALYYAINKNDTELVRLLIEKGSNVKHINDAGVTLLQCATKNSNPDILKLLLLKI